MKVNHFKAAALIVLIMSFLSPAVVAVPVYQVIPTGAATQTITLSGESGVTAGLTSWFWEGGNGFDYYAYQLSNKPPYLFEPYIQYFTIDNPTGTQFWVTGDAGTTEPGGTAWSHGNWAAWNKDSVRWSGVGVKSISPGYTSTTDEGDPTTYPYYFEFAVEHGSSHPGSVAVSIHQGVPSAYADGTTIGPVPEPAALILLGSLVSGLFGAAGIRKRFFLRS